MQRIQLVLELREALPRATRVGIAIVQREGHEEHAFHRAQKITHFSFGVIEILAAVDRRRAEKEHPRVGRHRSRFAAAEAAKREKIDLVTRAAVEREIGRDLTDDRRELEAVTRETAAQNETLVFRMAINH